MTLVYILLFFLYAFFVWWMIVGWKGAMLKRTFHPVDGEMLLTVVVPVRNEEHGISNLLEDLQNQSFKNFEVIVVNDHSLDKTEEVVMSYVRQDSRFRLHQSYGEGKKHALTAGICASIGKIIVTTDGDCRVPRNWLKTIAQHFADDRIKMVFGGVKIEGKSFFAKLQAHEFLSLTGTSAATLWHKVPSMCSGANLAFRKEVFIQVGGYTSNMHIPSGDDEFLLKKVFEFFPRGIEFVSSEEAVVSTSALATLKEFVYQRIRWAGKWRYSVSWKNAWLGLFIFCFHLSILTLPLAIFAGGVDVFFAMSLLVIKAVVEWLFLKKIARFVKVPWSWLSFVSLQVIYPLYAFLIGLISTFASFSWKGRRLKSFVVSIEKK